AEVNVAARHRIGIANDRFAGVELEPGCVGAGVNDLGTLAAVAFLHRERKLMENVFGDPPDVGFFKLRSLELIDFGGQQVQFRGEESAWAVLAAVGANVLGNVGRRPGQSRGRYRRYVRRIVLEDSVGGGGGNGEQ